MDVDLGALLAAHIEREADVTIVVRHVEDVSAFGLVQCRTDGCIEGFLEKRDTDPSGQNLINAGLYVFSPGCLSAIPPGVPYSNERQLFPGLIEAGKRVAAFRLPDGAYWADVGTPASYLSANADVLRGTLPWVPAAHTGPAGISAQANIIEPVSTGPGCRIEAGAQVGPDVSLGPRVVVGKGASVRNCILWDDATVGCGCVLAHATVGQGRSVAPGTELTGGEARILADDPAETDE